jgi:hypothetical protein
MATNSSVAGTQYIRYPHDYNLKELSLITPLVNGGVDLLTFMIELNLFEDIYSSTISGEVVLQDSLGLISKYLLNGTEFIQVQLQKTSNDPKYISRNYRVYKISKRAISDSNQYEVYVLNFCSEEFLLSEQYRLSKAYKGKQIDFIIKDIMNTYVLPKSANKTLSMDSTKGVYDFILPNKKIFETINWLSTYAQVDDSGLEGADMVFYENSQGYHFHSLQTLYKRKPYQYYKFDPKNILNKGAGLIDIQQQLTNVSDFEVLDFFDTLSAISNGTFSNKLITIDPFTRRSNTSFFNYQNYKGQKLNDFGLTNNYKNRLGGTMYGETPNVPPGLESGTLRLATTNSEQKKKSYIKKEPDAVANDIMIEKYLPNRVSQLSLANYMRIKITVPGDPLLSAGTVIYFSTYGVGEDPNLNSKKPDKLYTGKYLVTAVRHIVKNSGYITVMEICKDSVSTPYSGTSSALTRYINGVQI